MIKSSLTGRRRIIHSGRPFRAINISCERDMCRGYIKKKSLFSRKVKVEETSTYEMACDLPRTDDNFFGTGSYYAETETTGAYWVFASDKEAEKYINKEFYG